MKTKLTIILLFSIFQISLGQVTKDSTYKEVSRVIDRNSFRIGAALQKSLSAEIGFVKHKMPNPQIPNCAYGFTPRGYYSTVEWVAKSENYKNVFGLKTGFEMELFVLSIAIEAKYQTNFDRNDFVIAPKIGLGATRLYSFFYGYNISTNGNPFSNVGRHQFSLIFNLNKDSFKK